ncbi:hypothetical protein [Sphingomonas sp. BK580]|uniref:hypothetical protein n=1 Tax=Sphingomonas sp. BK580 TaxID=2586972 RepID=UPI00160EE0F1|nr:hypothetical protein [Sphingomonas sp. BK580]MBB3691503.1 hypothetical protein [Sphingomonas sp. BK580]
MLDRPLPLGLAAFALTAALLWQAAAPLSSPDATGVFPHARQTSATSSNGAHLTE